MAGFTKPKPPSHRVLERQRYNAESILGIKRGETYDAEKVRALYVATVKEFHPDGQQQREDWKHKPDLNDLRKAKDELIRQLENGDV